MTGSIWRAGSACALLLISAHLLIASEVNRLVPQGYMDEPFHIPQTQQYCSGDFQGWDPKITTFPGLYLLGTVWAHGLTLASRIFGNQRQDGLDMCSTAWLRALNIVLSLACYAALLALLAELQLWSHDLPTVNHTSPATTSTNVTVQGTIHRARNKSGKDTNSSSSDKTAAPGPTKGRDVHESAAAAAAAVVHGGDMTGSTTMLGMPGTQHGTRIALFALVLSLFPLHWFFTYLFYTDVGSLLFLLLCQLASLQGRFVLAAAAGAVAVLFRQTNAVWVVFVVGAAALRISAKSRMLMRRLRDRPDASGNSTQQQTTEQTKQQTQLQQQQQQQPVRSTESHQALDSTTALQETWDTLLSVWTEKGIILAQLWPLLLVPAAFAIFLVVNGGVTVGDKAAHVPVKHFAQLLYFSAFSVAMLLPAHMDPHRMYLLAQSSFQTFRRSPVTASAVVAVVTAGLVVVVQRYSLIHPYLIADNRHYTFYIFRKVLNRSPAAPYLLLPVYCCCWASLVVGLRNRQSVVWVAGFVACLALTLVPAWLWELRYYTPGFIFLAVHSELPSVKQSLAIGLVFMAVNAATMALFLYRPFEWADSSVARFMW